MFFSVLDNSAAFATRLQYVNGFPLPGGGGGHVGEGTFDLWSRVLRVTVPSAKTGRFPKGVSRFLPPKPGPTPTLGPEQGEIPCWSPAPSAPPH